MTFRRFLSTGIHFQADGHKQSGFMDVPELASTVLQPYKFSECLEWPYCNNCNTGSPPESRQYVTLRNVGVREERFWPMKVSLGFLRAGVQDKREKKTRLKCTS